MKIKFFGHNTFQINFGGKKFIVDPFITGNPISESKFNPEELEADYLLLTHAHGDHISDVMTIAKNNDCTIISNYEIVTYYQNQGIKGHPMNHGGKFDFDFGTVKYVQAVHSSSFPDGNYGGNPGGFVVWNKEKCIYIAGDTALTLDMKLIPMTCPKLDVAILPIGDNFTMGYEDAAIAAEFIACNEIIGSHYDTFGYVVIDHEKAKQHFSEKGKKLHLIELGGEVEI
jgi:L-ascorbate metabolism protein UlaG (beta-lactamase superfamily)